MPVSRCYGVTRQQFWIWMNVPCTHRLNPLKCCNYLIQITSTEVRSTSRYWVSCIYHKFSSSCLSIVDSVEQITAYFIWSNTDLYSRKKNHNWILSKRRFWSLSDRIFYLLDEIFMLFLYGKKVHIDFFSLWFETWHKREILVPVGTQLEGCDVNTGSLVSQFRFSSVGFHVRMTKTCEKNHDCECWMFKTIQLRNRETAKVAILYWLHNYILSPGSDLAWYPFPTESEISLFHTLKRWEEKLLRYFFFHFHTTTTWDEI